MCVDKVRYENFTYTDLSKAFDNLNHKLLIAKLHAYGFNGDSLKLTNDYLSNIKYKDKQEF